MTHKHWRRKHWPRKHWRRKQWCGVVWCGVVWCGVVGGAKLSRLCVGLFVKVTVKVRG